VAHGGNLHVARALAKRVSQQRQRIDERRGLRRIAIDAMKLLYNLFSKE
jgi:hypothetical protein